MTNQQHPIPILMEDVLVHTADFPVCDDLTCPCHEDSTLLEVVIALPEVDALMVEPTPDVVVGTYNQQEG